MVDTYVEAQVVAKADMLACLATMGDFSRRIAWLVEIRYRPVA